MKLMDKHFSKVLISVSVCGAIIFYSLYWLRRIRYLMKLHFSYKTGHRKKKIDENEFIKMKSTNEN